MYPLALQSRKQSGPHRSHLEWNQRHLADMPYPWSLSQMQVRGENMYDLGRPMVSWGKRVQRRYGY